jgi:AcrR family transcriptional regulator
MRDGTKTKKLIDQTALRLFSDKGIKETTIKEIAKAADIAEGTLYRHYSGKDELAERLFFDHVTALGRELQELQAPESTTRTKLLVIIRRFCDLYDRDPTVINYLFLTRHDHMTKLTARVPNPYFVFRRVIRAGMTKGDIPEQDIDVATSMVLGIILQIVDTRFIGSRIKQKISGLADHLAAACLRVLNA